MAQPKDINVKLSVNTESFDKAFEGVRRSMSPFVSALRGLSWAVEAHIQADSRVGANKRTVAVFMAAERLYEIDQGVQAGTLDSWGYPIEKKPENEAQ